MQLKPASAVAAFDFDGTLTRRDTLMPFLLRGLGWPRLLRALLACLPWLLGYALRRVSNDVAKQKLLMAALKGRSLEDMRSWTQRWMTHDFEASLQDWTVTRLRWHQAQGHCCVIVSASPDIYLQSVALQLGCDGLVCTEMETLNGCLTGLMGTPNCYGEQKVLRLKAWLNGRLGSDATDGITLYAYGDTAGDLPMLRLASHAWYRGRPWKTV